MRDLFRQARSELRLLPLMLGKLAGGVLAALGVAAAVTLGTRSGASAADALPYAVAAVAGMVIFVVSSRLLARSAGRSAPDDAPPASRRRTSVISWLVLILLAAGFLLVAFLVTR